MGVGMAKRSTDSGQALIESALSMPLMLFCVLGTLQLFLLLHARLIAEYAVYRAVRAGSLTNGDCEAMKAAAILSVLPAIERTDGPDALEKAFTKHHTNHYDNGGHTGQIIELWREQPTGVANEDLAFDQPGNLMRIEARMVFWVRLKIPFADWVLTRAFLAWWGLKNYDKANPYEPTQTALWTGQSPSPRWPGGDLGEQVLNWSEQGHYLFPIQTHWGMRMMTPAKGRYFAAPGCPL
jgi:hypothetical protein